ncbi:MAG: hypothetical protein J6W38_06040 [Prevotella sp.]|nr:hypothetical protein [Prevotella sp.]MBO7129907.1 hypothetical protein [Prevotella sp.]
MKRIIIVLVLTVLALQGIAKIQKVCGDVTLQVRIDDPTEDYEPLQKGPFEVPSVCLEGYSLYFATSCDGCTLRLVDANDNVVYSTVIPTGTTSLVLPSSLSGEYEIQIIQGNLCFYGFINL